MNDKISNGIETFNKSTVALKNVLWLFIGLVLIVLFWANTTSHTSDANIHLTPERTARLIILLDDFDELVIRVEKKDKRLHDKVNELKQELKEFRKELK